MITKIRFERLGANKDIPPIQIKGNSIYDIVRAVENQANIEGINSAIFDFRWNPHGDGKHYLVRTGMNSIVGAFTVDSVGS